jgi:hypothetical protein
LEENFQIHDTTDELDKEKEIFRKAGRGSRRAPAEINMLYLSAGGEFGSYGAGFMRGWAAAGPSAKPTARNNIHLVTGVSTGALMATYAFLGDKDEELEAFYLQLKDSDIYSQRRLSLLWANSALDTWGKQAMLEKNITSEIIDAVAEQRGKRALFVGLANLDSGRFISVDMTRLANGLNETKNNPDGSEEKLFKSKAQRDECYRAVIDGATAIEVGFPPVFIDGMMYGDGGVREHTFLVSPRRVAPELSNAAMHRVKLRMIMLIHGDFGVRDFTPGIDKGEKGVANGVLYIAQRAASIFTDQVLKASIRRVNALASDPVLVLGEKYTVFGVPANELPKFTPYYASSSKAACECRSEADVRPCIDSQDSFCPPLMRCLAKRGRDEGKELASSGNWQKFEDLPLGSEPVCPGSPSMPRQRPTLRP